MLHPRGTPRSGGLSRGWWNDAADVVELVDAIDFGAVDLVAHSAGTRLALATAAQHPDRVRSMVLVTPPASWLTGTPSDAPSIAAKHAERAALNALATMSADEPKTEYEFRESFRRQAPASYAHWTRRERTHAEIGTVSHAAVKAWFAGIPDDAVERIRAMRCPRSLVIGGDRDLLTGVQPVRDYAAVLGAELALIPDCGHYPWIEQPAIFRRHLSAWLADG
ncbi:alpha/beta hydrolase [Microbacterium sp. EYE_512]|uniref:Alpha/beta hydrolase n=1 Tax=Microbacterium wangchenii TaxID=2541726 RepID=A0ABX5T0D3_9MICO|nr:alpha/beta hydrolase [Microbacterium sp. EYE_512]QBR90530.1 alpha/beta hydrolase [Microbacterium wangchenii]TXK14852.1 alpha/beta hydrolase [Microbacterium wangchenii]